MVVNGYHFGICSTKKANYKKMNPYSKTILALIYLANRPNVERKEVNCFIHGEDKYSIATAEIFFDEETINLANQLEIDTSNYVILSEEELEERFKQMEENNNAKKQK